MKLVMFPGILSALTQRYKSYFQHYIGISPLLFGVLFLLLFRQFELVMAASALDRDSIQKPLDVAPFLAWLAIPTLLGFYATPKLLNLANSRFLAFMLATGFCLRLFWFGSLPPLDDDFYRYLWDGAVLAHGFSPYRFAPEQVLQQSLSLPAGLQTLAIAGSHTLNLINFPNLTSIYPGVAQLIFALAYTLVPWSLEGLRVLLLFADCSTLLIVIALLQQLGYSSKWAALYWCNPLVILAGVGAGHIDALLPPLVLGAFLAMHRQRPKIAAFLLALAVGIKIWPILLAPLLFRQGLPQWRRYLPALSVLLLVSCLALLPLLSAAFNKTSGLNAYASAWHINNAPFAWLTSSLSYLTGLDKDAAGKLLRPVMGGMAAFIALALAWRPADGLPNVLTRAMVITASIFYLSPAQFPWYALWFLPLAAVMRNGPLLLASATLSVYYLFLPLAKAGNYELFQNQIAFLHAGPVWLWLAWQYFQKTRLRLFAN
ncbi:MAG: glycosyltransferase 87 family protein [Methylococcaceae bacterium]|jgi:hypothetical protein